MDCEHDFEAARQQCDVDGSKSSLIADVDDRSFPTVDASLQQPLKSFHTCMYDAPHKKTTALWGNFQELKLLARTCDAKHTHLAWGVSQQNGKPEFATAEACAYNDVLSAAWASSGVVACTDKRGQE